MANKRKVEFQGVFNIQDILNATDILQNRFSKVKLDDSSARNFEKILSDIRKKAQEIDAEIKQGFTSSSQINTFNNNLLKLTQQMEILKGEIGRIDTSFENLQLSPNLQNQFEQLKISINNLFNEYENQVSNIENKISSLSEKMGISLEQDEIENLAQAISSEKELSELREEKRNSLQKEKEAISENIRERENDLEVAKKELEIAEQKQEMISNQLVTQKEKISGMRAEGIDEKSLQKQIDIQKKLTKENNKAISDVIKKEKIIDNINQDLTYEQKSLKDIESTLLNVNNFFNAISGKSSGLDEDGTAAAKEFSNLSNIVSEIDKKIEEINLEIEEFKKNISEEVSEGLKKSSQDLDNLKESANKASDGTEGLNENLEKLEKQNQFFNNLKSRTVAIFGLANAFSYTNRFIRSSVEAIKELDAAFTEIAVVTDMTTSQLWKSFDTYNEMAQRLGTTTVDAIKTSALYYQQGLETAEVMTLTEETMKMARIAGMDFADATDRMTAALRGFKLEMEDAQRVNDIFSSLAAKSAVDTDELSYALTKTASIAKSAGMEIETTSAFLSQMINFATYAKVA